MTYYLHNKKLFEIYLMPPDMINRDWRSEGTTEQDWQNFHTYLSTLQPIPHELKGEGVVALGRDFKWDLRGIGDPLYGSTGQPSYKAWQRVAVPIEAKEGEKERKIIIEGNLSKSSSSPVSKESFQTEIGKDDLDNFDFHIDMGNPTSEHPLQFLVDGYQELNIHFDYPEDSGGYDMKRIIAIVEKSIGKVYEMFGTDRIPIPAPSSVSNPVAKELKQIRDAFQWTFDNMGTPHTSDHFNVPANAIEQLDNLIAPVPADLDDEAAAEEYADKHDDPYLSIAFLAGCAHKAQELAKYGDMASALSKAGQEIERLRQALNQ